MKNDHLFRPGLGLPTKTIHDHLESPWGYYAYIVREDDLIREFYFFNVKDEHSVHVSTPAPDGTRQQWAKRWDGEYLVMAAPDGYKGEMELVQIHFKPEIQRFIAAPRKVLERFALGNRTSVNFGG